MLSFKEVSKAEALYAYMETKIEKERMRLMSWSIFHLYTIAGAWPARAVSLCGWRKSVFVDLSIAC